MDSLASALAIAGAAVIVAKEIYAIYRKVKNAPREIIELLEETQNIRIILNDIQNKEKLLSPWIDISTIYVIVRRASKQLEESQRLLSKFIETNNDGELLFKRLDWWRKKDEVERHTAAFRNIQMNSLAVMSCAQL